MRPTATPLLGGCSPLPLLAALLVAVAVVVVGGQPSAGQDLVDKLAAAASHARPLYALRNSEQAAHAFPHKIMHFGKRLQGQPPAAFGYEPAVVRELFEARARPSLAAYLAALARQQQDGAEFGAGAGRQQQRQQQQQMQRLVNAANGQASDEAVVDTDDDESIGAKQPISVAARSPKPAKAYLASFLYGRGAAGDGGASDASSDGPSGGYRQFNSMGNFNKKAADPSHSKDNFFMHFGRK